MYKNIRIVRHGIPDSVEINTLEKIATRWFAERAEYAIAKSDGFRLDLTLTDHEYGEGYEVINDHDESAVEIRASVVCGLYAGVGAFLRSCKFSGTGFLPMIADGISLPEKSFRGMYFATHFNNFYHSADPERIAAYVEDISLFGLNTLVVWFDMHHFTGIEAPEAIKMVERLATIYRAAKQVGMSIGLTLLANEGYHDSPAKLRADGKGRKNGYKEDIGIFGVELCPSKPAGEALILKWRDDVFHAIRDALNGISLDYVCIWPYDQGGCTCEECVPWGSNGFLRIAPKVADLAKKYFPAVKIILSTWDFDVFYDGEWDGFKKVFSNDPKWVDTLLVEPRSEYKTFPSRNHELWDLPQIGFPEISMMYCTPWGGFGANPYPEYIRGIWSVSGGELDGGFAYSEGVFEDINKFLISRAYWTGKCVPEMALQEYVAAYFPGLPENNGVAEALALMETTLLRTRYLKDSTKPAYPSGLMDFDPEGTRYVIKETANIEKIYETIIAADTNLSAQIRNSWRWRIVFLRAVIDHELLGHDFNSTQVCVDAYRELIKIYSSPNVYWWVRPPLNSI
jgi:hypothetical protein